MKVTPFDLQTYCHTIVPFKDGNITHAILTTKYAGKDANYAAMYVLTNLLMTLAA